MCRGNIVGRRMAAFGIGLQVEGRVDPEGLGVLGLLQGFRLRRVGFRRVLDVALRRGAEHF